MDWQSLASELKNADKNEIAAKVKLGRSNLKLSQKELADELGFDQSTISAMEKPNSKKNYSPQSLYSVAKFLNDSFGLTALEVEFTKKPIKREIFDMDALREVIRDEVKKALDEREKRKNGNVQELKSVDVVESEVKPPFDLNVAVRKYATLEETLAAWFHFEGGELPEDFAISFNGWESLKLDGKIETVRQIKDVIDGINRELDNKK